MVHSAWKNMECSKNLFKNARVRLAAGLLPILLIASLFHVHTLKTSADSAWYMSYALNIHNGSGCVGTDQKTGIVCRGPLFPMMIAASYATFGVSVDSALLVVRIFFTLNALMVFLLAQELYDHKTAFFASLLYLFSSIIHEKSLLILLDNAPPFFIMLGLWLLLKAFKRDRGVWWGLGGLSMAAAYLTKESTLVVLPLPMVYALLFHRENLREKGVGLAIFYISFFAPLTIWFFYTYSVSGSFKYLFGVISGSLLEERLGMGGGASAFFETWRVKAARLFTRAYTSKYFIPGILVLVSAGAAAGKAFFSRSRSDGFLIASLLCFMPLALVVWAASARIGNLFIVIFLSFIAFSRFLFLAADFLFRKARAKWPGKPGEESAIVLKHSATVAVIALILLHQVFGSGVRGRKMLAILDNTHPSIGFARVGRPPLNVLEWHEPVYKAAGEWIRENLPADSAILCERYGMRSIYFFNGGRNRMTPIPLRFSSTRFTGGWEEERYGPYVNYYSKKPGKPLFLWAQFAKREQNIPLMHLVAFREDDLLARLKHEGIDYVIITPRRNFLSLYFNNNPSFENVVEFEGGRIKIFKVKRIQEGADKTMRVGGNTSQYLSTLEKKNPWKHRRVLDDYLKSRLDLSQKEINRIMEQEFPLVDFFQVYPREED